MMPKVFKLLQKPWFKKCIKNAPKFSKFIGGQENLLESIQVAMENEDKCVIWFHASSLGEYNIARPVMKYFQEKGYSIFLTFFSPTGVEALALRKRESVIADYVFYLPLDTRKNAEAFVTMINPVKAVFLVSEYWPNYYHALRKRSIPLYLLSAVIPKDSYLMKWYGTPMKQSLNCVKQFVVLDDESAVNLQKLGFDNVIVCGDPLFDNAIAVANEPYHNTIVENFCQTTDRVFIAGSVHNDKDLKIVSGLANKHRDTKFIIVPHEISEEILNEIKYYINGYCVLYSECDEQTDFEDKQVLVIDFLGALSHIYRYGTWAYVGGGFTPYLHSVIEATVYGIPVAFGPQIRRKPVARQLISLGIGSSVSDQKELDAWFMSLVHDQNSLDKIKQTALSFVDDNRNATAKIVDLIS